MIVTSMCVGIGQGMVGLFVNEQLRYENVVALLMLRVCEAMCWFVSFTIVINRVQLGVETGRKCTVSSGGHSLETGRRLIRSL